jgi:ribosomal protein S18 acetylase RimI-like enzyme
MAAPHAITLRPARLAEAPTLAQMSRDLIEAGLGWRYTPRRLAALIADPETVTLVACAAQRIHGFAVMKFGDAEAHLILLCVRPSQRQRGIGRGLHQWLLDSTRVAGIVSVQLELRADNAAALDFYRRLGYTETRWLPDYYDNRIAARRMGLRLDAAKP